MAVIVAAPRDRVAALTRQHGATHHVAIGSPDDVIATGLAATELQLRFHDVSEFSPAGLVQPKPEDIDRLLDFARGWRGEGTMVVSCMLGISRSPAAALVVAAALRPEAEEVELARALRRASPHATPNAQLIALADQALGRDGRLIAAVAAIGRGADYVPQPGFALELP